MTIKDIQKLQEIRKKEQYEHKYDGRTSEHYILDKKNKYKSITGKSNPTLKHGVIKL